MDVTQLFVVICINYAIEYILTYQKPQIILAVSIGHL